MTQTKTADYTVSTLGGDDVRLLVTMPVELTASKKVPVSIVVSGRCDGVNEELAATVYGVPYKGSDVVTSVLLDTADNRIRDFGSTFCRVLVKKVGLPCYVSVSSSVGRMLDSGDQLAVIRKALEHLTS
ncbi:ACR123Cp [Eremothecium gossypii ATCC 10895]|uniref:ACR123Cp n=1 Tax=Eremothecium gossypii (strain ATCC 10895 / CBS 109.51 / FGSC 9923 / NRRL Y-1056) TaxID=284811 RepID=Q75BZ6_EREGS|nr:ACR123Cp [Eremothecium gossypii ATCC 10895]AAS51349.1 ACR123Cp [Eremothecium gossypii ATCC 10895]